jgi:hypothetical protein
MVCDNWSNDQDWINLAKEPESSGNKKARAFKEHLASWLVDCQIRHRHANLLLKILRDHTLADLPKDFRTLL